MNEALKNIVYEDSSDPRADGINVRYVDWSGWPATIDGQMCHPWSDGSYPDRRQPNLTFFKPSTKSAPVNDGLRCQNTNTSTPPGALVQNATADGSEHPDRDPDSDTREDGLNGASTTYLFPLDAPDVSPKAYYDSPLYKSPNPNAEALEKLNARLRHPNAPGTAP